MNTISDYQQHILSHMGICQWQLRTPAVVKDMLEIQPVAAAVAQKPVDEPIVAKIAEVPLAHQVTADTVSEVKPVAEPITTPDPAQIAEPTPPALVSEKPLSEKPVVECITDGSHPLVKDVLLALDLDTSALQKADLVWQLGSEVSLHNQQLVTPSLSQLATSPELKKQLWQCLQQWQP
ncbi:hypothetical protein QX776_00165 [Alteromonadaceae bacterium BrNp21-10]|nr:hypothetical protein [Alteromonadaceae bacterium BrNp21-10]